MHNIVPASVMAITLLLLGCASRGETPTTYDESKESSSTEAHKPLEPPKVKADDLERLESSE